MTYSTPHDIQDEGKLQALIESMSANGWQGAPLVKWGEVDLITGTHRYHAAKEADIEIPVIDLEDVFAEAGLDFQAVWEECGEPAYGEYGLTEMLYELPESVREAYGIDWE